MKRFALLGTLALLLLLVPPVFANHSIISGGGGGGDCEFEGHVCEFVFVAMGSLNPHLPANHPACRTENPHTVVRHMLPQYLFENQPGDIEVYIIVWICETLPGDGGPGNSGETDHGGHEGRNETAHNAGSNGVADYSPGHTQEHGASDLPVGGEHGNSTHEDNHSATEAVNTAASTEPAGQGNGNSDNPGHGGEIPGNGDGNPGQANSTNSPGHTDENHGNGN